MVSFARSTCSSAYSSFSSSSDLKVPSSLAFFDHGMLRADGTWPGRCDCSCGRWAGAGSLPENSSGERAANSVGGTAADGVGRADGRHHVVAEGADGLVLRLRRVGRLGPLRDLL